MRRAVSIIVLLSACSLSEHNDFLVGRQCEPTSPTACDDDQSCLPHIVLETGRLEDFRCRNRHSFEALEGGIEAPIAFCSEEMGLKCPTGTECVPDRIRVDVGARPFVCKLPGAPGTPPLDAGQ